MINYTNLRIFTSEKARHEGKPLASAVVHYLHGLKISARCSVFRGREGLYESGEISSDAIADLSYNLPILIDVFVPTAETDAVMQHLKTMVHDGFIAVLPMSFVAYQGRQNLLPPHLLVKDIMTTPPVQAHPDFSVRAVLEILLDRNLKALPVVDGSGHPIGIVTTTDLVAAGMPVRTGLFGELPEAERESFLAKAAQLAATTVMSENLVTVTEGSKASQAVHLMVAKGHKRLPVVDAHGRLVGMVARIDLMKAVSSERPNQTPSPPNEATSTPRTIRDIGKRDSLPVLESADLVTAIDVLVKQGEERAAVVDREGKLVGMVSDRELFSVLNESGLAHTVRRLFSPKHRPHALVSQVMKTDILSVQQDSSIQKALSLMVEHGIKRLPVVDGEHHYLGMIRRDALLIALSHDL
jgi:CBS domain-containing protein